MIRVISESLPFIIAGIPNELDQWGVIQAKETIENNLVANSTRDVFDKILDRLNPKLEESDVRRVESALEEELASRHNNVSEIFQFLTKDNLESAITNHALLQTRH